MSATNNTMASRHSRILSMDMDNFASSFRARNYTFTTAEAERCQTLYRAGSTVSEIRAKYFKQASLAQVCVAITMGFIDRPYEMIPSEAFDPDLVPLEEWYIGEPNPTWLWNIRGQGNKPNSFYKYSYRIITVRDAHPVYYINDNFRRSAQC